MQIYKELKEINLLAQQSFLRLPEKFFKFFWNLKYFFFSLYLHIICNKINLKF